MLRFLTSISLLFFIVGAKAQIGRLSDLKNEIGISARQVALGSSSYGIFRNASDGQLNPALLNQASKNHLAYHFNSSLGGIVRMDNLYYAVNSPFSRYAFGLGASRILNTSAFDTRNLVTNSGSIDYSAVTLTGNNDFNLEASVATRLDSTPLDLGLTFGVDLLTVAQFSRAFSVGVDLGATYHLDSATVISTVIENALGRYYFANQSVTQLESAFFSTDNYLKINSFYIQLPYLRAGINHYFIQESNFLLDASLAINVGYGRSSNSILGTSGVNIQPSLGFEGQFFQMIFIRLGISNWQTLTNQDQKKVLAVSPSVGFGVQWEDFLFDYSLSDFGNNAIPLIQHVLSVNYEFNGKNKVYNRSTPRRF